MNEEGFRQFLKKSGKKVHVVEGLLSQVRLWEVYLMEKQHIGLDAAGTHHLQAYIETLAPVEAKKQLRGLALYYQFIGNSLLANWASNMREQEVAQTRQAFKLRKFRGVSQEVVAKLDAVGIITVEDMLAAGKTPEARKQLSKQTGIPLPVILEVVKLSDLSRLGAIKSVRARLYYEACLLYTSRCV